MCTKAKIQFTSNWVVRPNIPPNTHTFFFFNEAISGIYKSFSKGDHDMKMTIFTQESHNEGQKKAHWL